MLVFARHNFTNQFCLLLSLLLPSRRSYWILDLNFNTIKGDTIGTQEDVETYSSQVKLPGASDCVIFEFHSVKDTTASWQAVMYRGEDFREAERTYANVFRLVKKSQLRWIDKSAVGFEGMFEPAKADVRFALSTLDLDLADPRYKNFKAEIELMPTYSGWEVHLNLHSKKPDWEG